MSPLVEFLLARIAEDQHAAQDCGQNRWVAAFHDVPTVDEVPADLPPREVVRESRQRAAHARSVVRGYQAHIARHDPLRVLAECEARRQIVQAWVDADESAGVYPGTDAGIEMGLALALELLAQPYRDHPDFQKGWGVSR